LLVEALDQEEWSCQRCQKLEQVKVGRSAQNRSAHNRWDAEAPENSSGVGVVRGGGIVCGMVWNGVGMVWNGVGVELWGCGIFFCKQKVGGP
jgi:hypothetical protein